MITLNNYEESLYHLDGIPLNVQEKLMVGWKAPLKKTLDSEVVDNQEFDQG